MSNTNLYNGQIIVDIKNLIDNINYLKDKINRINRDTLFMAVIKANAYGHGIEIVKYINNIVDYYGVANILEAIRVRKLTNKPILILGNSFEEAFLPAHQNNIILTIGSLENSLIYKKFFKKTNIRLNVHLKIDTGMGRVGILPDELDYILEDISKEQFVNILGVFTHLAESENINKDFTLKQINIFLELRNKIKRIFPNIIFHCANSSAILQHENSYLDMVRAGLSIYGVPIPDNKNLKQVLSLKSRIVSIKDLPENHYVGYNLKFKTTRKSKIAIVPLGYADGISRIFSNKLEVIVNNFRCPVIGNVSMDQITIDITDTIDVKIGDEVILINDQITIKDWAKISNKIPYEILCNLGDRIKRMYKLY